MKTTQILQLRRVPAVTFEGSFPRFAYAIERPGPHQPTRAQWNTAPPTPARRSAPSAPPSQTTAPGPAGHRAAAPQRNQQPVGSRAFAADSYSYSEAFFNG